MTRERLRCVGCEEKVPPERVVRVKGLGNVCMTCHEVIDLVWENAEGAWYATGCPDIEPRSDPERDAALRVVRAAKRAMVVLSGVERIESGAVDAFVVAVAEFEREETKGWPVPGAKPVGPSRSYGG